jgi:hypothetical protein
LKEPRLRPTAIGSSPENRRPSRKKITLTLEAKDAGPNPGDSVTKFKEAIAASSYFQEYVAKTNGVRLKDLGTPTADPSGKQFLLFTLECRYPEIKR